MAKHNLVRNAAKFTGLHTEKAVVGLARWATTDHMGTGKMLQGLPSGLGFVSTLGFILVHFLASLVGIALGCVWLFLVFAYAIPFLFF
ncbi:hypothetical protein SAMN05216344_110117 [Polaromonas sp. OV174]|uniref:hypothetical protein n=1 Tax=Polaromonas sp. OV174 TaxID=1855300 RepID=UPI0008EEE127|nr:hypothetical protein [Polaromonas sp. OV174]SFC17428.1 hypothetical protein SAMN05216344_110117 [Polaromonas sp. OV174]